MKRPGLERFSAAPLLVLAWVAACSGKGSAAATGSTSGGGGNSGSAASGGGASSNGGGGAPSGSSASSSSAGGAGGGPSSTCGDGVIQGGEACDDGNKMNGDYCAADCAAVTGACGDGVVQSNESCDDGVVMSDCDTLTNGGDGHCVPAGTCSPGYVYVAGKGCLVELLTDHVHIDVNNFCNMSVSPMEFTVPAGQRLKLSYHNHSVNYPVDVWKSYGGGFLDLQPGMIWNEQYEHCFGPNPEEPYADISTACSQFRLHIHCL